MELATGRRGSPHITSQQDRQKHQGIFGDGAYILNTGNMLAPEVQSSNKIHIKDGALMFQGALFTVKVGTYDEVTINNGNQGMKRKDLIVARYTYDSSDNIEAGEWAVIQGTPAADNPVVPEVTSGDIQAGDNVVECPVFVVNLDGINVTGVDIIPETMRDMSTLNADLAELRKYDEITPAWGSGTSAVEWSCICKNNRVSLNAIVDKTQTIPANTQWKICTIPSGYRPAEEIMLPIVINKKSAIGTIRWASVRIDPDGSVYIISTADIDTSWYIRLSAAWDI